MTYIDIDNEYNMGYPRVGSGRVRVDASNYLLSHDVSKHRNGLNCKHIGENCIKFSVQYRWLYSAT